MRNLFLQFGLLLPVILLSACSSGKVLRSYTVVNGGNADRGVNVIIRYKCGSCHTIPGIQNADGVFGPPLNEIARRSIIAGEFANEPDILVHWVKAPTTMKPVTAMPDLGLSDQQARDVAAYLETLR